MIKLKEQIQMFYGGNLTLFDDAEERFELKDDGLPEILRLLGEDRFQYLIKQNKDLYEISENHDILTNNLVTFSEITMYKRIPLRDMSEVDRKEAIDNILKVLKKHSDEFIELDPVGYEVTSSALIVCWYISPFMKLFDHNEIPLNTL